MTRRLYLRSDGAEVLPPEGCSGHFAIASVALTEHGIEQGNAETSLQQMWNLGFLRVVEHSDKIIAEQYPARLSEEQRRYLHRHQGAGKQIVFNDQAWAG